MLFFLYHCQAWCSYNVDMFGTTCKLTAVHS